MSDTITVRIQGNEFTVAPPFKNRELHLIKQIAGVRAGELWDALVAGDNDMVVALAHIAVRRSGSQRPSLDELWELDAGEIQVEAPEAEEEGADPTTPGGETSPASGSPETIQS